MVAADIPTNASLAEVLSARARRTPHDRLVIDVVGGVLIVIAAVWARPSAWAVWAAAAACWASYGLWAMAEVQLLPRPWPETNPSAGFWRGVQQVAAFVGVSAFLLFLFVALGVALGPIIS